MKKILLTLVFAFGMGVAAQAQPDPQKPLEAYSLFTENFRIKDYQFALPYGKFLTKAHPKEIPGFPEYQGSRVFDRMIKIYTAMAEEQVDPKIKSVYLDSAAVLFDQVFDTFTAEEIDMFGWTFNRGYFYQTYSDNIEGGMDKAVADYMKLYELDQDRTIEMGDGYYVSIIVQNLVANQRRDEAITLMDKAEGKVDAGTAEYFDNIRNSLFRSPEDRIQYLEGKLAADPESLELMNELFDLYVRVNDNAKIEEFSTKLYQKEPNFKNTMRMADRARKSGDYNAANKFLGEAANKATSNEEKSDLQLQIADNKMNMNDLRGARDAAKQATQLNPNNGRAFFKIAEVYANAVSSCAGSSMDRDDRVVYWLVLDYLDRAKRADASLSSTVNQQANTYAQVAPSAEDKFFKGWNVGTSLRVDGSLRSCYSWINESTTVR